MIPLGPEVVIGRGMDGASADEHVTISDSCTKDDGNGDVLDLSQSINNNGINDSADTKSGHGSKKRVHFLPDSFLVRVREIPGRNNNSSPESSESSSDSTSVSDDYSSDYLDSDNDHDEVGLVITENLLPPSIPTEIFPTSNTIIPQESKIVVSKRSHSNVKHTSKQSDVEIKAGAHIPEIELTKKRVTRTSLSAQTQFTRITSVRKQTKKTEGEEISLNTLKKSRAIQNKTQNSSKLSRRKQQEVRIAIHADKTHVPRIINSAGSNTHLRPRRRHITNVSTSLMILPTATESCKDTRSGYLARSMQSLSVGQLYSMNEFLLPSYTTEIHLPQLPHRPNTRKWESTNNRESDILTSNGKYRTLTHLSSHTDNIIEPASIENQQQIQQCQTSEQLSDCSRRYYAWQMANDSIQNTLQNTPSIAQLWDNDQLMASQDSNTYAVNQPLQSGTFVKRT